MRIEVHKINECGLYKKGSNEAEFATTLETLQSLKIWVNSRTCVENISIFEDKNSASDAEHGKRWREQSRL